MAMIDTVYEKEPVDDNWGLTWREFITEYVRKTKSTPRQMYN